MGAIVVDESRWPVLVVRFEGSASDAVFDEYLARMTKLLERKETTVTILDSTLSAIAPTEHRERQAAWIRTHQDALRAHSAGTAFVVQSAVQRVVLRAIFWLQPLPTEHVVVPTFAEAERWAHSQLRRRGVEAA